MPCVIFTFLLLCFSTSLAQNIAALTVNPAGNSELDIDTGITTLAEGGEIIDTERELTLNAKFIRYKDGEFIEASGGTSEGTFGLLEAAELRLEAATNIITATGGISLTKDGLSLSADTLTLDLNTSIAVLAGNVKSTKPAFETSAIVVKQGGGYALLTSPYRYEDSITEVIQENPGNQLQLQQIENEDGTFDYNFSTKLEEAIAAELTPYLP
ncbi:MAG: hypothetical protein ACRCYY_08570 [Trueperaceae bacterium]